MVDEAGESEIRVNVPLAGARSSTPKYHHKPLEAVQKKLCPVHRGTIAMSGRIAHIRP
jgi:hypothetical protein